MSNTVNRLPLAEAERIAVLARNWLDAVCERIEIAGSIRRRKPDCGDVELVCIPWVQETRGEPDLFGQAATVTRNRLDERVNELIANGVMAPRLNKNGQQSIGPALKWLVFEGFPLDIYCATPETWAVTLAIRTGSADFSHRLVTPTTERGLCPPHLHFKGWQVRHRSDGEIIPTPEERDVFAALGLDYIEPEART